ncbi:uncharacterized protein TM35_000641180 [Trypanosoma theileri]|uniref:Mucin TcMUCII n=1 Tax=Trypanosoma theileri TaxID=67003 RepID=A0A1X0NFU5_9TRYP|nr:uncharacterized protein TM35_000641180 [Trypanosoma theileri]ORC83586.1 hypothetical protein TM35_000641180 [Trypanosoma theileri]
MLLHRLLYLVALLLSVACVCGAAEEAKDAQGLHPDAADSSSTCDGPKKTQSACITGLPAELPAPRHEPGESGHAAIQNLASGNPRGPVTTVRGSDSEPQRTEELSPQIPPQEDPLGSHNNVQGGAADTHVNTPTAETSSSSSSSLGQQASSGSRGPEGQTRTNGGTTQDSQEENRNTETDTGSTGSQRTDTSTQHPTPDTPPADTTPSDPHSGDSNPLKNTSTEPNSTTDNVTTSEESAGTNDDTTNAVSESTTTTTTTTLPPELTNNKKGDADSSSSISSSVWVRVPLLIVVTLACILVC